MKSTLKKVTESTINNNKIVIPFVLLFVVFIIIFLFSTNIKNRKEEKYSEMKYKLDSVSYEYYKLENRLMKDAYNRDSVWTVEHKLEEQ